MTYKLYLDPIKNLELFYNGEIRRFHVENLAYYLMDNSLQREFLSFIYSNLNEDLENIIKEDRIHFIYNRSELTLYSLASLFDILSRSYHKKDRIGLSINYIAAVLGRSKSTIRDIMNYLSNLDFPIDSPKFKNFNLTEIKVGNIKSYTNLQDNVYFNKVYLDLFKYQINDKKVKIALNKVKEYLSFRVDVINNSDFIIKKKLTFNDKLPIIFYHIKGSNLNEAYLTLSPEVVLKDKFPNTLNYKGLTWRLTKDSRKLLVILDDKLSLMENPLYFYRNYVMPGIEENKLIVKFISAIKYPT